jgi:uncharacterized protein with PQ loop repeat
MTNTSLLTTIITWVVNISFVMAVWPQIYLNYKNKSVRGLSDLYIIGYFNGYVFNFLYIYSLNFHLAYKIRATLALFVISLLVFQRFLYGVDSWNRKIKNMYLYNFLFLLLISFLLTFNPNLGGNIVGWLLVLIWAVYQLPQLIKIHKSKSVDGFSFFLVSFIGIGNIVEWFAAYLLNLPMQTHLIASRGVLIYFILIYQFWIYKYKNSYITEKIAKETQTVINKI